MKTRFAFAGFRHAHAFDLLAGVEARADAEIVACCEEDSATRETLAADGRVKITHADFSAMLRDVECDVVAIGDYYARRGALAIGALRAGRHVLSDKPLCTSPAEQMEIERLAAAKGLLVGLQLDSRGSGAFCALREIIHSGEIGEVCTMRIGGQHPLLAGTRPGWYFERGKHGGTINDIGIHAFDFVPWMTGIEWRGINAARAWAASPAASEFRGCAQVMATLANGAGVLADFSYLAPDRLGYKLPHYWHVLVHGVRGLAETHIFSSTVSVIGSAGDASEIRPAGESRARKYLGDFLHELRGHREDCGLTSAECLRASRLAIEAQALADR